MEVDEPQPGPSKPKIACNEPAIGTAQIGGMFYLKPFASAVVKLEVDVYTAGSGHQSTLSVALHPLVIMNISEHWTRTKAQEGQARKVLFLDGQPAPPGIVGGLFFDDSRCSAFKVYGAIIGKHKGRQVEVMNSFELDYNVIEEKVVIDRDYYDLKESQFKQVHCATETKT